MQIWGHTYTNPLLAVDLKVKFQLPVILSGSSVFAGNRKQLLWAGPDKQNRTLKRQNPKAGNSQSTAEEHSGALLAGPRPVAPG